MRKIIKTAITAVICLLSIPLGAQERDSVDVLHYDIRLDMSSGLPYRGEATLRLRLLRECNEIGLQLTGTADTIAVDGEIQNPADIAHIRTEGKEAEEEMSVRVVYRVWEHVEAYGFGGLHVDNDMTYNLGVSMQEDPHPVGRTVFPCRDNFTDKATYRLSLRTAPGKTAECSGILRSRTLDAEGREESVWEVEQEVPTYIVGISMAAFRRYETTAGGYPVTIGYTTQDSATIARVFALLNEVVPMFERCFGPYRWGRIGYIGTAMGSMEHVNNIALARQAMGSMSLLGQSTIAHELGHAWFGNLITCSDEGDMWINEGGATFCSEVAREATSGKAAANGSYQENLDNVLLYTHHSDNGYRPLHGMPHDYTYGSTTYDKGGLVWHSLRGYLGDTLFYSCMRRLMERCAFGNIDAEGLRDSLSRYSGVDLTDFFRFHVFGEGFVDYRLRFSAPEGENGGEEASLYIGQTSVGTEQQARGNRVPVYFFSADGRRERKVFSFQGTDTLIERLNLPFRPQFCVLDLDCELSDAATVDSINTVSSSANGLHTYFSTRNLGAAHTGRFYVEHHYSTAEGIEGTRGVLRAGKRHWVVCGPYSENEGIQGRFAYRMENSASGASGYLDEGFYTNASALDSMVLMWRPERGAGEWRMVSTRHSNDRNEGYFIVDMLRTGEYCLAVADTAVLGLPTIEEGQKAVLMPNPVGKGERITVRCKTDRRFSLSIIDMSGRTVWTDEECFSGKTICPRLSSGTYNVRIENDEIKTYTKMLVL